VKVVKGKKSEIECIMDYIQRISFDESKNIKYLAKGDFGEVHKATRFYHQDYQEVVLERIHNSNDTIKL
jgi:hypothetical protein